MGFGHRVYKNYDPRAKLMQETCNEVLAELGLENDPLFKLAKALEKIALEDDYFVSRKLYPNVDFYSGIVQRAIGIPVNLFTGIFALARTVGWIAQLNEMISDPEYKIGRPRQLFTGSVRAHFARRIDLDLAAVFGTWQCASGAASAARPSANSLPRSAVSKRLSNDFTRLELQLFVAVCGDRHRPALPPQPTRRHGWT
jgi:hypothetical protein